MTMAADNAYSSHLSSPRIDDERRSFDSHPPLSRSSLDGERATRFSPLVVVVIVVSLIVVCLSGRCLAATTVFVVFCSFFFILPIRFIICWR